MLWLLGCSTAFAPLDAARPEWLTGAYAGTAATPRIQLNEIMAENVSTVSAGTFEYPDWVELVNEDVASLPLSRLSLTDGAGNTWTGEENESIAPGAPLVLFAEEDLDFRLDAEGDELVLAIDGTPVQRVAWEELDPDVSWARYGDTWARTGRGTPGAPNGRLPEDEDPSAVFYNDARVTDVWIEVSDAGVASLWADPYTEVPGSLAFEGAFFPEVGVRLKGVYGSLRNLSQKCSFKIDVNQYDDVRLRGIETFAFNNMVQDPSYTHEFLTFELSRAMGIPAPRVGYVRVWFNGDWFGLYANIEYPDDRLLDRWYEDPTGNLYEGEYGEDLTAQYLWELDQDEGDPATDRADLAALITALEQPADEAGYQNLRAYFDMDEFAAVMAMEAIAYHWDGYTTRNNYRVYHDPASGLFDMLPWGADQTWHDAWYEPYTGGGVLMSYCMAVASCRSLYATKLGEAATHAENLQLEAQMDHLYNWLYADISSDPRREWGMDTVNQYIAETRTQIQRAPARMRTAAANGG